MPRAFLLRVLCVWSCFWCTSVFGVDFLNSVVRLASYKLQDIDAVPTYDLARIEGYKAEGHRLVTTDDYVIHVTRIVGNHPKRSIPILLTHGLLSSSDNWVMKGRGKDLPYILADLGYDVWLGDWRGNTFSKEHLTLSTEEPLYWNFTFYHRALYDLPVFIDHILEVSKAPQLIYIGYSYGTTASLILTSKFPEYNKKIRLNIMLAPVGYKMVKIFPQIRVMAESVLLTNPNTTTDVMYELLPRNAVISPLVRSTCWFEPNLLCMTVLNYIFGQVSKNMDHTIRRQFLERNPAGASSLDVIYLAQIFLKGFYAYDFGKKNNLMVYGKPKPPKIEVERITVPTALFYSTSDHLNCEEGILKLSRRLRNVVHIHKIQTANFSHLDYMYGKGVEKSLYKNIVQLILKYSY